MPGRAARRHGGRRVPALADLLSDRPLWRTAPTWRCGRCSSPALLVVALVAGVRCSRCCCSSGSRAWRASTTSTTSARGRSAPASACVLLALALPAAALAIAALETLYRVLAVSTHALLVPRVAPGGPVREMLAESLGDRTVSVAYWLPDRERFVDEHGPPGRAARSPAPAGRGPRSSATAGGVAAIIHDAALDTTPRARRGRRRGLVAGDRQRAPEGRPAGAGARSCGCRGCGSSRRATRRGGGSSATCTTARSSSSSPRARPADAEGAAARTRRSTSSPTRLATALAELRELARGIHPAILTDRGLAPAIQSLADRGDGPDRDRRGGPRSACRRRSRPPPTSSSPRR